MNLITWAPLLVLLVLLPIAYFALRKQPTERKQLIGAFCLGFIAKEGLNNLLSQLDFSIGALGTLHLDCFVCHSRREMTPIPLLQAD